jgi:hypothetical protein
VDFAHGSDSMDAGEIRFTPASLQDDKLPRKSSLETRSMFDTCQCNESNAVERIGF